MASYQLAHLSEIEERSDGQSSFRAVRHHFGIQAFGVTASTGHAIGDRIINEHDESEPDGQDELYLVLSGLARFELDGESVPASSGTFVSVPAGMRRTAFAEQAETTILAMGATQGQVYKPSGWELWSPLRVLYDAGEYGEAARKGRELLENDPPYATVFYNVACCESLNGETEAALAHLRRAVELSPTTREFARDDTDLDALRELSEFAEIMSG
jgi:mannose-6-phosphate isomerase-like protein (cupin superfamily)